MGQEEICKILRKNKRWMTAKELSAVTGVGEGTITASLRRMYRYNEIKRIDFRGDEIKSLNSGRKPYLFKLK